MARRARAAGLLLIAAACSSPGTAVDERHFANPAAVQGGDRPARAAWRLAAAEADLSDEHQRIATAFERFRSEFESSPGDLHDYVISFSRAPSLGDLLDRAGGMGLSHVFTWIRSQAIPEQVMTSTEEVEDSASFASDLEEELRDLITSRHERMRRAGVYLERSELLFGGYLATMDRLGVPLSGIRCLCSPAGLRGAEAEGILTLRAVERYEDGRVPIWPVDPLRDRIIETAGYYGI